MIKKLSFFIFISFCLAGIKGNAGSAPENEVDSLNKMGWKDIFSDPASTIKLADTQYELSSELDYRDGLFNALYQKGYAFDELSYYDKAAENYYKALKYVEQNQMKNQAIKKVVLLQCLGVVYEKTYGYELARQFFSRALEIALAEGDATLVADLKFNLGIIHYKQEGFHEAGEFFEEVISMQAISQKRIAKTYNMLGIIKKKSNEFEEAKSFTLRAYEIASNTKGMEIESAVYLSNIGENYFNRNEFDSAKYYYSQALAISEKLDNAEKIKWLNNNLGDVAYSEANYKDAISYYQKSIALGKTENIDKELKRAYQNIAKAYDATGNFRLASEYKDKYMGQLELLAQTKDRLQEQNAQYRMKEMEWNMERLAKNEQIEFYKTSVFWFRVSLLLIVFTLAYISYFTYKYRRKIVIARRLLSL